jgi:hypothetical protein
MDKKKHQCFILANDWFDPSQQSSSLSWKNYECFSLFFFYAPSLEDLGVLMILEEKNHFFKNLFSNEMVWTG